MLSLTDDDLKFSQLQLQNSTKKGSTQFSCVQVMTRLWSETNLLGYIHCFATETMVLYIYRYTIII